MSRARMGDLQVKVINGAAAGVIGVATTFPLDLVKTNLQLNRSGYNGILDCFKKIYSSGGIAAFYKGIKPNILLISPEKAIKLSCNDIFRKQLLSDRKKLPLTYECIAGGGAGLCQVVVTTPMELLKIRGQSQARTQINKTSEAGATQATKMQANQTSSINPNINMATAGSTTQNCQPQNLSSTTNKSHLSTSSGNNISSSSKVRGTTTESRSVSAFEEAKRIIKRDGIRGIYKGVGATLMRDIPFSMVYFPLFAHLNHSNLNPDGTSKPLWSLISGVGAGAFSAWLFTPVDYVKTTIQSPSAQKGLKIHTVVIQIVRREGVSALFTGAVPRVMVVAPLFGVAQATYYIGIGEMILGRHSWDKPTL